VICQPNDVSSRFRMHRVMATPPPDAAEQQRASARRVLIVIIVLAAIVFGLLAYDSLNGAIAPVKIVVFPHLNG
jgi:hypothetical protein